MIQITLIHLPSGRILLMDSKLGFCVNFTVFRNISKTRFQEPERDLDGNYFGTTAAQRFGMKNKQFNELMTHKGVYGASEGQKIGRRGGWEK